MSAKSVTTGRQFTVQTDTTTTKNDSKSVLTAPEGRGKITADSLKAEERTRCSIWSRVMGYHRPTSYYNIGKKQEFADRKYFKEPKED